MLVITLGLLCSLFFVSLVLIYLGLSIYTRLELYIIKRRLESIDDSVRRGYWR